MLNFGMIAAGFASVMTLQGLFYIALGTFVGIIFGAVPGLSGSVAIALFIPVTYTLEPNISIALIMGLMMGGVSGGLISAILLNIPGTAASFGTTFDGHPMAMRGEAGKALGTGIVFSFIGGLLSMFCLILIAPTMAKFALKFGTWEYFTIAVFALTMVASLSGKNMVKGLISGCFGFVIAMVGIAPVDFTPRFTFGVTELQGGFALISVLTGSFALGEVMKNAKKSRDTTKVEVSSYKIKGFGFSMKEFITQLPNCIRSAIIGIGVGILPGVGASTSNLIAYSVAKDTSKYPEKFGTGIMDGIVASESANNGTVGGAMIPLLALGIPGDVATALMLGALTLQGIQPGHLLFVNNAGLVYTVFAAMIIANVFMILMEYVGMRGFVRLLTVSKAILMPTIMVLCCVGAFSNNNRAFDIAMLGVFGMYGMLLQKFDFPVTPLIIGYIVGPIAEQNLRRALILSDGSFLPMFHSPIAVFFLVLAALSVFLSVKKTYKERKAAMAQGRLAEEGEEDI